MARGKRKPSLPRYTPRKKIYLESREFKPLSLLEEQQHGGVLGATGSPSPHGGGPGPSVSGGSQLKQTFMSDPENRRQVVSHLSNLPENIKLMILNNYRDFMSNRHMYLTHEQIAEIDRAINRARTSRRRAEMSSEERAIMNQSKREYMSRYRAKMTEEKKALLKVHNRERMSHYRSDMTSPERENVKSVNREYMSQVRNGISPKEREKINQDNSKRMQDYRAYVTNAGPPRDDKFWAREGFFKCWPHQYS